MKKQIKKKQNNLATKEDIRLLKDELRFLEIDLKQTKIELNDRIRSTENYLDYKIGAFKKEMKDFIGDFQKFKNWMYDKIDWLVNRMTDQLDNHEARIAVLEKKAVDKTS